jgi:hypothetical protein
MSKDEQLEIFINYAGFGTDGGNSIVTIREGTRHLSGLCRDVNRAR